MTAKIVLKEFKKGELFMTGNMFENIYRVRSNVFGTKYENELSEVYTEIQNCINNNSMPQSPRFIMFKVIDRCNSGCIYCGYAKQNHVNDKLTNLKKLNTQELISVFDQAADIGVDAVALNGGEPLLRDDISRLVSALYKRKILPILMTNGVLLERKWDELGASGLKYIIMSMDSLNAEHYEFQRGIEFSAAMRGISAALAMRKKYGNVMIHLTTVLTKYNLHDIIPLLEFCNENQIWLEISVYDTYGMTEDVLSVDEKDSLNNLVKKLLDMKKNGAYLSSSEEYIRHLPDFCINHERIPKGYSCYSGYGILLLDNNLDARPCWGIKVGNVGNLSDETLTNIWKNNRMNYYRTEMLNGRCGGCWNLCTEFNSMIKAIRNRSKKQ